MARLGLTLTIAVVLMVSFQEAFALNCYSCNSTHAKACGSPFEKEKLKSVQCFQPQGSESICLKITKPNVIIRRCDNQKNVDANPCKKPDVCEHCSKDECNGALQYGPAAIIVAIPIAIMKIFSLL